MTLRTRRIFFWALIPCFFVGGAFAVLYSQGYRVDAATRTVTKVGALYVRGYPRSATITLDGEPINTGSWWPLQSGTLDGSLAPGTYKLHAEAPGYRTWDADVVIKASLVTERKSLVLFPDIATQVTTSPETVPVMLDAPDAFEEPVLITGEDNPRALVGEDAAAGTYVGTLGDRLVLTSSVSRGKTTSQLLTLQAPDADAATTVTLRGEDMPAVQDDSVIQRESAQLVAAYDSTGRRTVLASSTGEAVIGSFLRMGGYDAWELDDGTSTTLVIRRRGTQNRVSIPTRDIVSLQPAGSSLGVLDAAGSLWLINPDSGVAQEVGHRSRLARWKDDGSAVASVTDGDAIEVIALEKDAPDGKLGGTAGSGITALSWYPDGEHLFVETSDALVFADVIDGASAEQHAYRLPLPQSWAYSADRNALYVLIDGTVMRYVFPD